MSGEPESADLLSDTLLDSQRLGFLGARPIPEVIGHARGFVRALGSFGSIGSVVDLGSGGGIPGLVIAHDLPNARVTLLDRRSKRTDALERAVRRLGWQDRVMVRCQDVTTFRPDEPFDAVVARGFGPPEFTLSHASRLVRVGGTIVISEPPGVDRWDRRLLDELNVRRVPSSDNRGDEAPPVSVTPPDGGLDGLVVTFIKR